MKVFIPKKAFINPRVLDYTTGRTIVSNLRKFGVPVIQSNKVEIDEVTPLRKYIESKKTVFVTLSKIKKLDTCRPSADYEFALSGSCPALCEYCYLQTTQGEKPYIRIFANVEDILGVIRTYIEQNLPNITSFECASITDPVALEHLSGSLGKCIEFFGKQKKGRLRLVTKFNNVESFLNLEHNQNTKFRFSINADSIIKKFEHKTCNLEERLQAAKKVAAAGYPIGFIVAPIFYSETYKKDYELLIKKISHIFANSSEEISFELIQHRFMNRAKELILERFPNTSLDLDAENRQLKWGPYGRFKHVYPQEKSEEIKNYLYEIINANIKNPSIEYFT